MDKTTEEEISDWIEEGVDLVRKNPDNATSVLEGLDELKKILDDNQGPGE